MFSDGLPLVFGVFLCRFVLFVYISEVRCWFWDVEEAPVPVHPKGGIKGQGSVQDNSSSSTPTLTITHHVHEAA